MKRWYVRLVRATTLVLRGVGALALLDRLAGRSRLGCWARSLLAIYDVDDLMALDVPWWTFHSAEVVEAHLASRPHAWVFEWGSGASTRWLSARAAQVVAVEHDASWAAVVK